MKKTLLTAALLTAFGVAAVAPQAANAALPNNVSNAPGPDGTITITGNVIAQSCLVDGKAAGTSDAKTVPLPTVLTSDFAGVGSVTGATPFNIAITNCNAALSTVQASFSGVNVDTTNGDLKNAAAGGSNVEVQLLNNSGTAINLSTGASNTSATLTGGNATLNYTAQYIETTAPLTAGSVNTTVNFTLVYQ